MANDLNLDFALITNRKPKDHHRKKSSPRKSHHKNSISSRQGSVEPEESQSENSTRESESDAGAGTGSGLQERKITRHQSLVHHSTTRYKKISLSGSVSGRKIIVVDDMIDTGQTIKEAMEVNIEFFQELEAIKYGAAVKNMKSKQTYLTFYTLTSLLFEKLPK